MVFSELSTGHLYSYCVSGNIEASLHLLQFCPISLLSTFQSGKTQAWIFNVLACSGLSFLALLLMALLLPGLSWFPSLTFFFLHLLTLSEVITFLIVTFQLLSLYISGQIHKCSGCFESYVGKFVGKVS